MSAKEKTTGFLAEFRKFIARGNVMDLAVGVIIGGAFKGITDSLVNDILNPVLGIFAGDNEALAGLSIPLPGGGDLMLGSFLNVLTADVSDASFMSASGSSTSLRQLEAGDRVQLFGDYKGAQFVATLVLKL